MPSRAHETVPMRQSRDILKADCVAWRIRHNTMYPEGIPPMQPGDGDGPNPFVMIDGQDQVHPGIVSQFKLQDFDFCGPEDIEAFGLRGWPFAKWTRLTDVGVYLAMKYLSPVERYVKYPGDFDLCGAIRLGRKPCGKAVGADAHGRRWIIVLLETYILMGGELSDSNPWLLDRGLNSLAALNVRVPFLAGIVNVSMGSDRSAFQWVETIAHHNPLNRLPNTFLDQVARHNGGMTGYSSRWMRTILRLGPRGWTLNEFLGLSGLKYECADPARYPDTDVIPDGAFTPEEMEKLEIQGSASSWRSLPRPCALFRRREAGPVPSTQGNPQHFTRVLVDAQQISVIDPTDQTQHFPQQTMDAQSMQFLPLTEEPQQASQPTVDAQSTQFLQLTDETQQASQPTMDAQSTEFLQLTEEPQNLSQPTIDPHLMAFMEFTEGTDYSSQPTAEEQSIVSTDLIEEAAGPESGIGTGLNTFMGFVDQPLVINGSVPGEPRMSSLDFAEETRLLFDQLQNMPKSESEKALHRDVLRCLHLCESYETSKMAVEGNFNINAIFSNNCHKIEKVVSDGAQLREAMADLFDGIRMLPGSHFLDVLGRVMVRIIIPPEIFLIPVGRPPETDDLPFIMGASPYAMPVIQNKPKFLGGHDYPPLDDFGY